MSALGGCLLQGVCSQRVSALKGMSALGVSAPGGVCSGGIVSAVGVSAPRGMPAQGGVCSGGGICSGGVSAPRVVSASGGCGIPACTEADTPPVNRMTDRCKNITLTTTSLWPVKIYVVIETVELFKYYVVYVMSTCRLVMFLMLLRDVAQRQFQNMQNKFHLDRKCVSEANS